MTIISPTRLLLVVLVSLSVLAMGLVTRSAGTLLVVSRPLQYPDAIVSLASHEWERLPAAAQLAARDSSSLLLLTLPQPVSSSNCHDCGGRVARLERLGVPASRIRILPLTSAGTYGEAQATLAFARQANIRRLVLITTPYHTRRSLATFGAVFDGSGIAIGVEPASSSSPARPDRWWAAPYDRAYVAYEWAAVVYYVLRYRIAVW
jgi:uncharacterized SAM-binding protein YcdF (DUF218 family)